MNILHALGASCLALFHCHLCMPPCCNHPVSFTVCNRIPMALLPCHSMNGDHEPQLRRSHHNRGIVFASSLLLLCYPHSSFIHESIKNCSSQCPPDCCSPPPPLFSPPPPLPCGCHTLNVCYVILAQALLQQAAAMQNFYLDPRTYDRLRNITNRVLIVHGVQDLMVPVRNAAVAAARIPASWMIQAPQAGHGIMFQSVRRTIA